MRLSAPSFSVFLALSTAVAEATPSEFETAKFKPQDIIKRDVAVIGGGSSGTYAALSLKDAGKSVIVVEKKGRIGGHANTYTDPETNISGDMGIVILHNITEVHDFFRRFDLPLSASESFYASNLFFDFRTGKAVTPTFAPTAEEIGAAFTTYLEQYSKYPDLVNGTILGSPVPEELYMPFGDFVEKYGIQAAVPAMYMYNPGSGDLLSNPVVEQFRYWSSNMVQGVGVGFISPVSRNMSEIFAKAQAELSSDSSLLLSSEVVKAHRPKDDDSDIKLVVRTPTGPKLIIAKKLVIAIPPKVDYLAPFDLSPTEKSVFSKYIDAGYYVGALKNSGFLENASISNAAEGNTKYDFPILPAAYSFSASRIPGVQFTTYSTPQTPESEPLTDEEVKKDIINTAKRIQKQNPDLFEETEPEFVAFHAHSPYNLQFRAEDIKNGIYDKLYSLQGERNTHWTGAAWKGEDSSLLWKYTKEFVVPKVLEGL